LVHASPRDPLDEYSPPDPDFWSRRLAHIDTDVVCVGHTHHPYVLEAEGKRVINPGSVGQPRDNDPRASYAIIQDGQVQLKRVPYPIEETIRTINESPLPPAVKTMLAEVYRRGGPVSVQPANGLHPPHGSH
ncbi:MAG: metallophosphoesterase family protein, partial [Gemmataceae bacterium]